MLIVEKQIMINLTHKECWMILRDISLASNYIPGVEKIEIISSKKEGIGATRKAYLEKGSKVVDETVIDWENGTGFTLKLEVKGQRVLPWFNEFYFQYHIEEADHKTFFKPAILYQPRSLVMLGLQRKVFHCVLGKHLLVICASMKSYYETNIPTSKARLKEIRKNLKS
jgi:hypothetical protein